MKQIILDDFDIIKTKESSSKGNQPKVKIDGLWYKKDHMGYEALAEVVISKLLGKSNVSNFVKYSPIKILKNNIEYIEIKANIRLKNYIVLHLVIHYQKY